MKKQHTSVNENIKADKVLLIHSSGEKGGLIDISEALAKAKSESLDLVQVSPPGSDPVVCKLLDFGKFLFDKQMISNFDYSISILSYNYLIV